MPPSTSAAPAVDGHQKTRIDGEKRGSGPKSRAFGLGEKRGSGPKNAVGCWLGNLGPLGSLGRLLGTAASTQLFGFLEPITVGGDLVKLSAMDEAVNKRHCASRMREDLRPL